MRAIRAMHPMRRWVGVCLWGALAGGASVLAQTSQTLVGTVRDPSGATVPGVTVTARHVGTNESRQAVSDDRGDYRIIQLNQVGEFEVAAELTGFRRALVTVLLTTGQTARVDLTLEIGDVNDECRQVVGGRLPGWNKVRCVGNLGRNPLDGPGYWNLDLGISKNFRIREQQSVELRGELFNAFNHPNLGFNAGVGLQFDLPGAARLTSAYPSREIQLSLRYAF